MITVAEAIDIIQTNTTISGTELIPILDSSGRVLRRKVFSERDLPPFDRVMMDGITIQYASFLKGKRKFKIQQTQPAGAPKTTLMDAESCIEIMTGAIMPNQADTVIRYEDLVIADGWATIQIENISPNQNVHAQAKDRQKGELLLSPGRIIGAAEIGVLASLGITQVEVSRIPNCTIISTGDELVEIDTKPLEHQIRRSNVYMIQTQLKGWKIEAEQYHLVDNPKSMEESIAKALSTNDILILSGGVSKGKFDYLPQVLTNLGVEKKFHKIRQKPGKPFWFGVSQQGTMVFALPGNPVSSFLCLTKYVWPYLYDHLGAIQPELSAALDSDVDFKPLLDYFLPVKLNQVDGLNVATPFAGHGSGDFANLLRADGFLHLPKEKKNFKKLEVYPLILFRNIV